MGGWADPDEQTEQAESTEQTHTGGAKWQGGGPQCCNHFVGQKRGSYTFSPEWCVCFPLNYFTMPTFLYTTVSVHPRILKNVVGYFVSCMCVLSVCLCVPGVCLAPAEVRREGQVPWN